MISKSGNSVRQLYVFERETMKIAGADQSPVARHIVVAAVFTNPFSGYVDVTATQLEALARLSVEIGEMLTQRALDRFHSDARPSAYGKAIIVGASGNEEQGAAMIHASLGHVMRRHLGSATALIPGVAKMGGMGAQVDLAFGDKKDVWRFDAMDSMEVSVPGAPKPDEAVLFIGFGGLRANARVEPVFLDAVR